MTQLNNSILGEVKMFHAIVNWIFNGPEDNSFHNESTDIVHTEDSLSELTKSMLKDLGEEQYDVVFKSEDRKVEMINRILSAQAES
jgi:hypothetical protein